MNTAGYGARISPTVHSATATEKQSAYGCYSAGLTLFKSAFIVFCIVVFESLLVFFTRGYLQVSAIYPALAFAGGFIQFIVCAILYALGYKPRARRKKHASYGLTATVIFVICVLITTMVAVYCKAQISDPKQLLSFVIIPVVYLLNIIFFVTFFYLFSVKASTNYKD